MNFLAYLPSPRSIIAIARVSMLELVRMRMMIVMAALSLGFLALQFLPIHDRLGVEFSGVAQLELIRDVGMGCMYLFGLMISIAATALLIPKDEQDRILYTILAKPVKPLDYLMGKALGVLGCVAGMGVVLNLLLVTILRVREASLAHQLVDSLSSRGFDSAQIAPHLEALHEVSSAAGMQSGFLLMGLCFIVLTGMTLLISTLSSGTLITMMLSLGLFFVGQHQQNLFATIAASQVGAGASPSLQWASDIMAILIPNFELFTLGDGVMEAGGIPLETLASLAGIACIYFIFHLMIASWAFRRKLELGA